MGALTPKKDILENVVMLNLARMDRFLPAIMSVIYAGISPAQALAAATRQARGELRSRRRPPTETQDIVRRREFLDKQN
jgi:hypothetical protein